MDLSAFFQTKAQANDFCSRVATISEKIYETDFDLEKALIDQFGLKKKDTFMKLLHDQNVAVDNSSNLKQFLTDVQKTITSLPVLTLVIAFEPKEKTLKALSEWFVMNIKSQMLFEINIDTQLIAGASISFNGRDADYSIRPKFDKTVAEVIAKAVAPAEK